MFEHLVLMAQREADERFWQLAAACQPHLSKDGQQEGWKSAKKLGEVGWIVRSSMDMVDTETRVGMIGSNLKLYGDRWAARHRKHLDWLSSIGVTPAEAIERHEAWMSSVMADPFWKENRGG